jgi:glycosyltransferase involved in cell wall biosynthesis
VASELLGYPVANDAKLCAISGRYEYKNKGIDLYINALNKLNHSGSGQLVAFILVPGWQQGAKDLSQPGDRYTTHQLVEPWNDPVSNAFRFYGFNNSVDSRVKVIFVPAYLMGDDGIFNMSYYDLLAGFDFTVFPSYYEPWGYTPMESVAFAVPTITTNLSGFGRWVNAEGQGIELGVGVVKRGDNNFDAVSDEIVAQIEHIMEIANDAKEMKSVKTAAQAYAKKAQWKHFFKHYKVAYDIALKQCTMHNA